jgi:hypothetical protein
MPSDLPLANERLLVNFGATCELRDIYWPHSGLRNNTLGHVNHSGVWVDGVFSWFGAADWRHTLVYEPVTLVTHVTLSNTTLQLTLSCTDIVGFHRDVLIRKMRVLNTADHAREIRLFFHHNRRRTARGALLAELSAAACTAERRPRRVSQPLH